MTDNGVIYRVILQKQAEAQIATWRHGAKTGPILPECYGAIVSVADYSLVTAGWTDDFMVVKNHFEAGCGCAHV